MNLGELNPKGSTFKLKSSKKAFTLRPVSLLDEDWLDKTYGSEKVAEIFAVVDITEIARIAFQLMKPEDRLFFKTQEVITLNEDGSEEGLTLGGLELFKRMIVGNEDKVAILNSLLDTIGASRPIIEPGKKKAKKSRRLRSGMRFLICFLVSMVGKLNIFGRGRTGK